MNGVRTLSRRRWWPAFAVVALATASLVGVSPPLPVEAAGETITAQLFNVFSGDSGRYVGLSGWTGGSQVRVEVLNGATPQPTVTVTVDSLGFASVDFGAADTFAAGTQIVATSPPPPAAPTTTKTLTVADLRIEYVNPTTDQVQGHATPGTSVEVIAHDSGGIAHPQIVTAAAGTGIWTTDFTGTVDIQEWQWYLNPPPELDKDEWVEARVVESGPGSDGDVTVDAWSASVPHVDVIRNCCGQRTNITLPGWSSVGWRPGANLRIEIFHPGEMTPWFVQDPVARSSWTNLFTSSPAVLGDRVVVRPSPGSSDGIGWTREVVVVPILVEYADPATDVVAGTAPAGSTVRVQPNGPFVGWIDTTASPAGEWSVDMTPLVDLISDGTTVGSTEVTASVFEPDLDAIRDAGLAIVPVFQASTTDGSGTILPVFWNEDVLVTAEIDTDHDGVFEPEHTLGPAPSTLFGPQWNAPYGWLVDGSVIRVSGGGWTKQLMVRAIRIEQIVTATDVVSGTGPPVSSIDVGAFANWGDTQAVVSDVLVDASGWWQADFGAVFDLVGGTHVAAYLTDGDGDSSVANGTVAASIDLVPDFDLEDGQSIALTGFDWPANRDLYVTQCRLDIGLSTDSCDTSTQQTYETGAAGAVVGSFMVKRHLSTGAGAYDCAGGACGLVGIIWPNDVPFSGYPEVIDFPENNWISFEQGKLWAVGSTTDLVEGDSVTLQGSGFDPGVQVTIWRCYADGDPSRPGGFTGEWCGNVDGSPWLDEDTGGTLPSPAAYVTTTTPSGTFEITFVVPRTPTNLPASNCGTTRMCKFIATASAGPGAYEDPTHHEVRLQFLTDLLTWPAGGVPDWTPEAMIDTVLSPLGTYLADFRVVNHTDPSPPAPAGATFPYGVLHFDVIVPTPGATATVQIHLPTGSGVTAYEKLAGSTWVPFANANVTPDLLTLILTDGGIGDLDGVANGVIVEPGAPAIGPVVTTIPGLPGMPVGVAGTGQVFLTWTAPVSNGGSAISDYIVERSSDGGGTWSTVADGISSATLAIVSGLAPGSDHVFRVAAVNSIGTGPRSLPSMTVSLPPVVPGEPGVPVGVAGNGQVSVSWTAPVSDGGSAITGYVVTASPGGATCSTAGVLSCTVAGLTNGQPYTFTVRASNIAGPGPASAASISVTPRTVPGAPGVPVAIAGDGLVELSWTAPVFDGGSAILDYTVQYSSNGGASWVTFLDAVSTVRSVVVTGLTNGQGYVFRVLAVNVAGTGPASAASSTVTPFSSVVEPPVTSGFHPLSPVRVFDTRPSDPQGVVPVVQQKYGGVNVLTVKVTGVAGVPTSGVGAVSLNVTAVDPVGAGFVTVYPCGVRPLAANINYVAGEVVPNAVIAPVSASGEVCFYSMVDTHLVADINGWFAVGAGFEALSPVRVFDTRPSDPQGVVPVVQQKYGGVNVLTVKVTGVAGVPTSGVGAVSLNVTAVDPVGAGFVTVYPCGVRPLAANINYVAGEVVPNAVIAPVSASGEVCFYSMVDTHLVADINGWFAVGAGFEALSPVRVFDTRPSDPQGVVPVVQQKYGGVNVLTVKVTGVAGVPTSGVGAVSLNVTAVDPVGAGFVTVYPCGVRPLAANINYVAGEVVPNAVIAPVSASGEVCFYSMVDTHLVADINGWFASSG